MHLKQLLGVIIVITLLTSVCFAGDFSFTGSFTDLNQVQYFTFSVTSGSKVVIQSYGYGGGSNSAGVVINGGGFDPSIALFHGAGPTAPLYKTSDDEYGCAQGVRDAVSGVCYDVYWEGTSQSTEANAPVIAFEPGTYVIALTNYGNFANGQMLGDGFSNTGSAFNCAGNTQSVKPGIFADCLGHARDGHWAIDIRGVENAQVGIVKPQLVITANAASRAYGEANPAFAGVIAGLENGDAIGATYASAATVMAQVGTYSIVPTVLDPAGKLSNYNVILNNGTLSVTKAPLTVVATNASRPAGQPNPTLSGTITGVVNGDNISATYSTTAHSVSLEGTYPIEAAIVDPDSRLANYSLTVTAGTLTVTALPAPQPVSVSPNAGGGASAMFSLTYSDSAGFAAIASTRTIFNSVVSNVRACGVLYTAAGQTLAITNDAGTAYVTPTKLGTATVIENSQCSINLATSSVSGAGNQLTLNLAVTFKSAFAGAKNIFMFAQDKSGATSGWQDRGDWTVTPGAPTVVSIAPNSGTGMTQLFQVVYSDPSGFANIASTRTIVNTVVTNARACGVLYTAVGQTLAITNDAGTAYMNPTKLGSAIVIENSQCSIDLSASSVSGSGNNLTLNLAITFKPTFSGAKGLFTLVQNKSGLTPGWQTRGTWTTP